MTWDLDQFKGVFVAMYSAYDATGEVDKERVKKLANYYADSGIKGLYVGGSSGEGILQTMDERKEVLEAVMSAVGEKLTIIAHIGANSTRESVELAQHAEKCHVAAVSSVPSIYYRLPEESVERHWKEMIEATSLPFIIYHIPQTTGFNLTSALYKKMVAEQKVIGIKMSAESVYELQQLKANADKEFLVLNGPDEQYLGGRIMGADGGIGGTYGVMPQLYCELEKSFFEGQIKKAQFIQAEINRFISRLLTFPSLYGACKAILSIRGIETGQPRLPLLPIEKNEDWLELEALNQEIEKTIELVTKKKDELGV
ncbi:N-acetylneuraminate lyase [Bacillus sp. J14TS2]|uniref:dihydrodipicolinate synthase family protein n=1 Tax=Bacillus sp. J14TS2 TaxID=2807188 RepID=UPI001B21C5EB|nr:dihydrodipicolinate synthase family protein [Bacillus sp. J14TS2]GIN69943.1 N-acetylneuraminate lyase [Bacillus sp. J14TS2]